VVATAGILSIIGTLRYELAIVLPPDDSGAANLAAIAMMTLIADNGGGAAWHRSPGMTRGGARD